VVGIVRKSMTATVCVNECAIKPQMRSARAGEFTGEDDFVDITRVSFVSPGFGVVVFPLTPV
jgi:hypothetical protein